MSGVFLKIVQGMFITCETLTAKTTVYIYMNAAHQTKLAHVL